MRDEFKCHFRRRQLLVHFLLSFASRHVSLLAICHALIPQIYVQYYFDDKHSCHMEIQPKTFKMYVE
jgi:hypothetical protein